MRAENRPRRRRQSGVTLIEMLVVVTIIALFAALVGPQLFKQADKARITAARTQIDGFMNALGQYKLDTSAFPATEQGLAALRIRPANMSQWNGPYLTKEVPLDPWQHPYQYKYPSDHGDEPEIISLGRDGQPGGEDMDADIVSWKSH